jgi:type I restriction-modification system DNA methylase subunit
MVSQELKKTLWTTADKLRSNMDAAEYKHIVLGLIFLKYVSDTFSERRVELRRKFTDPDDEYYLSDQAGLVCWCSGSHGLDGAGQRADRGGCVHHLWADGNQPHHYPDASA